MSEQLEKRYTDKAEFGQRPKDFTFQGMAPWVREMFRITERNARRRNITFALTRRQFRDLVERSEGRCMMSGIEFDTAPANGRRRPFAPSLDRIDSTKGYNAENCRLVCVIVNLAMNEWGAEDLIKLAKHLIVREREILDRECRRGKYAPAGFVTVRDFCSERELSLNNGQRVRLSARAMHYCRQRGIERVLIPNVCKDGSPGGSGVMAYPAAALEAALTSMSYV